MKLNDIYKQLLHLMSPAHYQISHCFIAHRVGSDNELVTSNVTVIVNILNFHQPDEDN
jgi:hypothetical protein